MIFPASTLIYLFLPSNHFKAIYNLHLWMISPIFFHLDLHVWEPARLDTAGNSTQVLMTDVPGILRDVKEGRRLMTGGTVMT